MYKISKKLIESPAFSNPMTVKSTLPNPNLNSTQLAIKTKEEQAMPKLATWSFLESLTELPKTFARLINPKSEQMRTAFKTVESEQVVKASDAANLSSWKDWTLHNIAARESGFNSKVRGLPVKNGERAMGMFQFMPSTAKGLGVTDFDAFLNNPKMQYDTANKFFDQGMKQAKNYGIDINYGQDPMGAAKHMYGYWYGGGGYFRNLKKNPGYLNAANYAGGQKMPSLAEAVNIFEQRAVPYTKDFKSPYFK